MKRRNIPSGMTDFEYLRDLAERLMRIPVVHGTDQGDVSRLLEIARREERRYQAWRRGEQK